MRTTVTIDADVERLLREAMHKYKKGFKQALNDALRKGLQPSRGKAAKRKFVVKARPMRLNPGIDPATLADIDTDAEIAEYRRKSDALTQQQ